MSDLVIAEAYHALRYHYEVPKEEARAARVRHVGARQRLLEVPDRVVRAADLELALRHQLQRVDPAARRKGLGRAVMAGLEDHARRRYGRLILETGTEQPESVALYESCGFRPIPCWGESADNPRSRCYEKVLSPDSEAPAPR